MKASPVGGDLGMEAPFCQVSAWRDAASLEPSVAGAVNDSPPPEGGFGW